jgi:hypothetical protein
LEEEIRYATYDVDITPHFILLPIAYCLLPITFCLSSKTGLSE